MHCPQCGHRQDSDEIRFCTKCGLDISDVRKLLNFGSGEIKAKHKNKKRKAARQGLIMVFVGLGLVMILGALREFYPIPKIIIVLPLLVFMIGGMLRMMLPGLSDESDSIEENVDSFINDSETSRLSGEQISDKILPEAQYRSPIHINVKDYDTNELVQIPSVTEDTTKRLKKETRQK